MRLASIGAGVIASLLVIGFATAAPAGGAFAGDRVPRMEATELLPLLDSPDVMIIDVRRGRDWDGSELMIKNAVRRAYNDVDAWMKSLPRDKKLVLYCA